MMGFFSSQGSSRSMSDSRKGVCVCVCVCVCACVCMCVCFHDCSSLADAKQHLSFRFKPAHLLKLLNRARGATRQGKKGM